MKRNKARLTKNEVIDLCVALELRILHYHEQLDARALVAREAEAARQHVRELQALHNKLLLLIGEEGHSLPLPYAPPPTDSLRASPTARRGTSWGDTTEELYPLQHPFCSGGGGGRV